jgi:hypothetical protein
MSCRECTVYIWYGSATINTVYVHSIGTTQDPQWTKNLKNLD